MGLSALGHSPPPPKIVTVGRAGKLVWLRHLCRMQEQDSCRILTFHKPEGTGQVGRPVRWLDAVEDLEILGSNS